MIYRANERMHVYVEALGRDVLLDPAVPLDDTMPDDKVIIDQWRRLLTSDNIESATAAPGEKRTTRRKPAA